MPDDLDIQPCDIPPEIEELYEGEWIAWDCAAREVIAHDVELGKLMPATDEAYKAGRPIYFHHILPRGAILETNFEQGDIVGACGGAK